MRKSLWVLVFGIVTIHTFVLLAWLRLHPVHLQYILILGLVFYISFWIYAQWWYHSTWNIGKENVTIKTWKQQPYYIPLPHITHAWVEQSLLEKIFHIGRIYLKTHSTTALKKRYFLWGVPDPFAIVLELQSGRKDLILRELLQTPLMILTTIKPNGLPQSSVVEFAVTKSLRFLIGTRRQFRKYRNIQTNPNVSLAFISPSGSRIIIQAQAVEILAEQLKGQFQELVGSHIRFGQFRNLPKSYTYFALHPRDIKAQIVQNGHIVHIHINPTTV